MSITAIREIGGVALFSLGLIGLFWNHEFMLVSFLLMVAGVISYRNKEKLTSSAQDP